MINLFRNKRIQRGAATLIFTIIMLTLTTLIIVIAASSGQLQSKITSNQTRNSQAFYAAEAGLEFGINYLQRNSSTILASPSGGYISPYSDSNTTNVTLANNSKFTVVYTNPLANNYKLIKITATGTSDDGIAIRTVSQLVQFGSVLLNSPTIPLTSKNNVSLTGSADITNTNSNTTIQSAKNVSLNSSATTTLSSGTSSTAGNLKSDIQQNVSALDSLSQNDLFGNYFGLSTSMVKNNILNYYSNNSNTTYNNALNGKTGTSIWIDQTGGTATINGFTVIGSSSNPVIMVTNGNLNLGGLVIFYGLLYVMGTLTTDSFNFVSINGALIITNSMTLSNNAQVTYNPTILNNLQNQSTLRYYAKVPGTWKDF